MAQIRREIPSTLTDGRLTKTRIKDVHIPKMPELPWQIAKGAATIDGMSIGLWVALAILEKWDRKTNYGTY